MRRNFAKAIPALVLPEGQLSLPSQLELPSRSAEFANEKMVEKDDEIKFLVTTQKDHFTKAARYAQICAVRSHLTSRQHANRLKQAAVLTGTQRTKASAKPFEDVTGHRVQRPLPMSTHPDGHPTSESLRDEAANTICDGLNKDLSIEDLIDIFEPSVQDGPNTITNRSLTSNDDSSPVLDPKNHHYIRGLEMGTADCLGPSSTTSIRSRRRASVSISHDASGRTDPFVEGDIGNKSDFPSVPTLHRSFTVPIANQVSSTLDPFIRLPLELTQEEKSLLHFCKSSISILE